MQEKLKIVIGYPVGKNRYYLGQKRITKNKALEIFLERLVCQGRSS